MAIAVIGEIFTTAAVCGIIALLLYHLGRLRLYIQAAKFPGPRAFPVIGNAHFGIKNSADIMDKFIKLANSYPSPFRFWLGHKLLIFTSDPEQLMTVLHSPYAIEKSHLYKFIRPWFGTGLATAPAAKWRKHRRPIASTFTPTILASFVKVFASQAEVMTKKMRKELEAGEFEVYNYVSLCVIDIVCETTMGVNIEVQEKNSRYAKVVHGISKMITERMFHIWLHPDYIFHRTKLGRDQCEALKYLNGVTNNVIQMKKRFSSNETRVENESAHEVPAKSQPFLDFMREFSIAGTKLTDEELCDEINTIMAAGSHSVGTVTTYAMIMLVNNPEIQKRVYRELCDIYGDQVSSETSVKHEDLKRMEYCERVIKETLRLFPMAPLIGRQVSKDFKIGEYTLPKGAEVILLALKIHRSEKYWPDPLKFDPDRFLPEEVAKRNPYCYMPFSAGPRNCIGMNYAIMVVKVLLATVLRRYVLKTDKIFHTRDIKFPAGLLLPIETMMLKISERVDESVKE